MGSTGRTRTTSEMHILHRTTSQVLQINDHTSKLTELVFRQVGLIQVVAIDDRKFSHKSKRQTRETRWKVLELEQLLTCA